MLKIELADFNRNNGGDGGGGVCVCVGGGGDLNWSNIQHWQRQAGQICHKDTLPPHLTLHASPSQYFTEQDIQNKIIKWRAF